MPTIKFETQLHNRKLYHERVQKSEPYIHRFKPRRLHHRTPTHPAHPPVTMMTWNDHEEVKMADGVRFTSKSLFMTFGDHAGTHVDAPVHFDGRPGALSVDQMPLENFYTSAFCLDLSHKPLKSDITIEDLKPLKKRPAKRSKRATRSSFIWASTTGCRLIHPST